MTNSQFTNDLNAAHIAYGKSILTGEKAATKFYDTLDANAVPFTHYLSPTLGKKEGTASPEWFEAAKLSLAKGRLPAADFKLFATDPKSLTGDAKARRTEISKVVGSLMKDVKNALKSRQQPKVDVTSNAKGKAQAPKAPSDKLTAQFESLVKTIQGNDDWKFDAADMIAAIQKLAKQV